MHFCRKYFLIVDKLCLTVVNFREQGPPAAEYLCEKDNPGSSRARGFLSFLLPRNHFAGKSLARECVLGQFKHAINRYFFHSSKYFLQITGDEAFKSICRILGPLTKKPTLGVQHAVEAGYLFKEHASISAWLFTFLSYCEVTKPLSRIKTITRMRRIYKRRLVIAGFIISACSFPVPIDSEFEQLKKYLDL